MVKEPHSGCAELEERGASTIETNIPLRLDRLPWARFHLFVVAALGVTWLLDGLEVTVVGSIGPALLDRQSLGLAPRDIGVLGSCYVAGAVVGALVFGWLADRYGRRAVFYITLVTYLLGVAGCSAAWNFGSLAAFRLVTGAGIGGEYAAINSAIDELVPARLRGRVALFVNGSYWIGAAMGAAASLALLDPEIVSPAFGWRLGFGIGGILGLCILFCRRYVPESPRWLIVHGRQAVAEKTVADIEAKIERQTGIPLTPVRGRVKIATWKSAGLSHLMAMMMGAYRARSLTVIVLMIAQAFLFNALFFTYSLVLSQYYQVPHDRIGLYILPLSAGNFLGPLLLGRFFDTTGRRRMMTMTFAASALLVAVTALLFLEGELSGESQTVAWVIIFFFASPAASSVYLLAGEIFPIETRALAIAVFYAIGTAIGGIAGPWVFGALIADGSREALSAGYLLAGLLMAIAAVTVWKFGVDAENKPLEALALPDQRPRSKHASL